MDWGSELQVVGALDTHGPCQAVAVRDGLAYICAGYHGLIIADVSDPAAPAIIGGCDTWLAFDIALGRPGTRQEGYAFVADRYGGLQVVDVRDPRAPRVVRTSDTIEFATGIALAGDLLLLPCRSHGTQVMDVSDPERPRHLGFARTGESQGVVVRDHFAYVGVWAESKLAIVDIADPCRPRMLTRHTIHGYGYGLTIKGDHVFAARGHHDRTLGEAGQQDGHGFDVIDVSDPGAPRTVAVIKTPKYYLGGPDSWQCEVSGDYLFLADGLNGLYVFDITDPANPVPVAHHDTPGYAHNLDIGEGLVYVADCQGGLQIIAAEGLAQGLHEEQGTPPVAPAQCPPPECEWPTWTSAGQVRGVATDGEHAWLACGDEGLEVLELGDPPRRVGHLPTRGIAYDITVQDGLACLADGPGGATIVDVRDPAAPTLIVAFAEGRFAREVARFGDRLLVMHGNANLDVYDISDPSAPELLGLVKLPHFGKQIATELLEGRYALVSNGFGIHAIDLEAEGGPALAWSYQTREAGFYAKGLALLGNTLLVTSHRRSATFDLSDPLAPVEAGQARLDFDPARIEVRGDRAWLLCETTGQLAVVDISDPNSPAKLAALDLPGHPKRLAFTADGVLVADGVGGMHVIPPDAAGWR